MISRKILVVQSMVKPIMILKDKCMLLKNTHIIAGITLIFIFLKIYQHNIIIKLTYEQQRLEHQKRDLEQKLNEQYIQMFLLQDPDKVFAIVQEENGMTPIKLTQIQEISKELDTFDYFTTPSSEKLLKQLGFYDITIQTTKGYKHART